MHPAYSVIVFTTASGAGFGLLAWLALWAIVFDVSGDARFGFVGLAVALGLAAAGLLASTLHLGRPERAWRAFSQWRTSWLSREGVSAIATLAAGALFGLLWVFNGAAPAWLFGLVALDAGLLALVTVWCTGMIYQSLPTIRAWHQPLVSPVYLALAIASGGMLLVLLLALFGRETALATRLAVIALLVGALLKLAYWRTLDAEPATLTAGAATGLGAHGTIRVLDPPHSRDNFVMREMGFAVGRRHAERLRQFVHLAAFVLPVLLLSLGLFAGGMLVFASLATVTMAAGLIVERWLFFAEAQHAVTLFYGAQTA
jgi:DMSO reductase anchor subunit